MVEYVKLPILFICFVNSDSNGYFELISKAVLIKGSQNIVFEIYVNPENKRMPKIVSCVVS